MDYKKKYEEALKKIKRYVIDEYGCIRLKPSDIFPELAESEDEKVRKEIIEVLQLTPTTTWERANTNYDRCFAWLEKQKEQKYQTEGTVFEVGETITDGTSVFTIVDIKDGHYIADDGDKVCFYVAHKYYTLCKEQKPVEWSEEDEENLDAAIDMAEHTLYEPLVQRDTLVSWLKSLKDRIKGVTILKVPTSKPKTENETIDLIGYE